MSARSVRVGRLGWERDFRLLWSGSAISQIGTVNATLTAPLLALGLTGSPVFAGWVTAAGTLPRILLHLPAGMLVDRTDRRRVMIVSLVVRAVLAALVTASVLLYDGVPVLLLLAAMAQGVCLVFYTTAETTVVPRIVPSDRLPEAMAKNEARVHGAALLGRPLGGLLFDVSRWLPFAADVLASAVSLLAVSRMRKEWFTSTVTQPLRLTTLMYELFAGLVFLRRDGFLLRVLIVCTLSNFFFQTLGLVLILLAQEQKLSSMVIGCLVAASGFGGLLGSFTAPRLLRVLSPQQTIVLSVWCWMLLTSVLAVIDHGSRAYVAIVLPLAWGGIGYTGAHLNVALALYQAADVPEELLGRVISASRFFSGSAVPLGALASGYVVAGLGTQDAAGLVAVVVAILAVVLSAMLVSVRTCLTRLSAAIRTGRRRVLVRKRPRETSRRLALAGSPEGSPPPSPRSVSGLLPTGRN